ncbi:hypothetical protein ACQJBY_041545 [Aegilops geniculata]
MPLEFLGFAGRALGISGAGRFVEKQAGYARKNKRYFEKVERDLHALVSYVSELLDDCPEDEGIAESQFAWFNRLKLLIDDFTSSGIAIETPPKWILARNNIEEFYQNGRSKKVPYTRMDSLDGWTETRRESSFCKHNCARIGERSHELYSQTQDLIKDYKEAVYKSYQEHDLYKKKSRDALTAQKDMNNLLIKASTMLNDCPIVHGGIHTIPFYWLVQVRDLIDDFKSSGSSNGIPKGWTLVRDNIEKFKDAGMYWPEGYAKVDSLDIYETMVRNPGASDSKLKTFSTKAQDLITEYDKNWKPLYTVKPHCTLPSDYDKDRFISFECRSGTKDKILRSLKEHRVTLIHGPGGIGKTTMLSEIAETAEKDAFFSRVVYARVPRDLEESSAQAIQSEIAQQLGVPWPPAGVVTADGRSTELKRQIADIGNVLVILDDVWKDFDMTKIGIPSIVGLKLLIGTRLSGLAFGAANKIPVNILTENDSWLLLLKEAPVADKIKPALAKQVQAECCGLPLALAVIGKALCGKEEKDWECAANYLKNSDPACPHLEGVEDKLYKIISYSYDHLPPNNVLNRTMFLCCCLFPESEEVHAVDLGRYLAQDEVMKEHLAEDVYGNSETKVLGSADILEKYGLLQNHIKTRGTVMMHDVVRDVGVYIARKEKYAFIVCGAANQKKGLRTNTLTAYKRWSLRNIKIADAISDCPQLETLLVRENTVLPHLFFEKMVTSLAILDLSHSDISALPSSMEKLQQVRTLLLNGCKKLIKIDEIVRLSKLDELSLRKSVVQLVPKDLVLPTVLDWEDSSPEEDAHPLVTAEHVPGLRKLKELSMHSKYITAEAYQKITEFDNLEAVKLYVTKSALSSYDSFDDAKTKKWEQFTIYNHGHRPLVSQGKHLSIMDLEEVPPGVKALLKKTEEVVINHCFHKATMSEEKPVKGAKSMLVLAEATGKGTFEEAKILRLKLCPNISYLTSKDGAKLKKLEEIELTSLKELLGIFKPLESADTDIGTFLGKVHTIAVTSCDEMKCVVPNDVLQKVHNTLQVISVRSSKKVECIFHPDAESSALLTVLRSVEIDNLEMLECIWQGIPPQGTFRNLKEFTARKCNKLTSLFTAHVAVQLENLQKLTVEDNTGLKQIISVDAADAALIEQAFQRVTHLSLQELPTLEHFSSNQVNIHWPRLVKLNLRACLKLTSLPIGPESAQLMKIIDLGSENDLTWYNKLVSRAQHLRRFEKWVDNVKHV